MFLWKQSHAVQGKMSHSKSISTQSFPTQQAYSPGLASEYPGWNEAPALLRSISPSAGCKAWKLLGHQVESPLPILIHCRDWSNVTGSLAKIPINISCKDREMKLDYKDGKQGPWSLLGELHINIALRNGHHYTLFRALGLYKLQDEARHDATGHLKPEWGIWLITSILFSLWREILSPSLFLKSGTHDSANRNLESELLKLLLLEKIESSHYF